MELGKKLCESLYREDSDFILLLQYNITEELFDGYAKDLFNFIRAHKQKYYKLPSSETIHQECKMPEGSEFKEGADEPLLFYIERMIRRSEVEAIGQCLIDSSKKLENIKINNSQVDDVIDLMGKTSCDMKFSKRRTQGKIIELNEETEDRMKNYIKSTEITNGVKLFHTPWEILDKCTFGIGNSQLWIIVARTGIGKTWNSLLFLETCRQQCSYEEKLRPPLYISLEMPTEEVIERADCIRFKLPYKAFREGKLSKSQFEQYFLGLEKKEGSSYYVTGIDLVTTTADVHQLIDAYNPGIVIIDGLWLFDNEIPDRFKKVHQVSGDLRTLCLVKNIPIVATAQFRDIRDNIKESNKKRHGIQDIAESAAIARNAYAIYAIYQPKDFELNKKMIHSLLKFRGAKPLHFISKWDLERMDFTEIEECDEEGNSINNFYDQDWQKGK